jgi:sigma-B regulation protein RsbU (phosphoserine phosphatase)
MSSPSHLDELSRTVDRLHRIVDATKLLNSTLDLRELTRIILQLARDEVGVERGTVYVVSEDGTHLQSLVAQEVEEEFKVRIGTGIAGTVAKSGEVLDIADVYKDDRFDSSFDQKFGFKTHDAYCMPIRNRDNQVVGVLQLLNRTRSFTQADEEFLAGISVHMGLALENASMHRQIVEKKRIEQELGLAREIQEAFHPKLPESHGGVEISGSSDMCYQVGGDYFSFFPLEEGRFIAMLGDVSGKGIGAALVMTSVHAMCRALVKHVHSLERITFVLNDMLLESTQSQSFLTLLMMLVDPLKQRVHFISAGHNPPVLVNRAGEARLLLDGGGPPVGLFHRLRWTREIMDVEPGSTVVIYTDGVSETERADAEMFGTDRLCDVVRDHNQESGQEIHAAIRRALKDFVSGHPANDDVTMMVLKF